MEKKVGKLDGFQVLETTELEKVDGGGGGRQNTQSDDIPLPPPSPKVPPPGGGGADQYDPAYTGSGL